MKYSDSYEFDCSAAKLFKKMTDPDYLVEQALRQGAVEASIDSVDKKGDQLVIVVRSREKGQSPTGKVLEDKLFTAIQTQTWNTKSKTCHWKMVPSFLKGKVDFQGNIEIEEDGKDACVLHTRGEVKVKIPVVGGKAAKIIGKGFLDKMENEMEHLQGEM